MQILLIGFINQLLLLALIKPPIKIAEGAKIVENVQRDVNIALINELHQIFTKMEIDTNSVIEAASTK